MSITTSLEIIKHEPKISMTCSTSKLKSTIIGGMVLTLSLGKTSISADHCFRNSESSVRYEVPSNDPNMQDYSIITQGNSISEPSPYCSCYDPAQTTVDIYRSVYQL